MICGSSARCFFLTICILQIVSTAERQLFDFLGRMWAPILFNFFNFILVVFGFFGVYHYKVKYVISYVVWLFLWLGWNTFVICFYLSAGVLDNKTDVLNFGTGTASWWEVNGPGCRPVYPSNLTEIDVFRPLRPEVVSGCIVKYEYVECIHAGIQCLFAIPGIIMSLYLIKGFNTQDENCKKKQSSIYFVEYSSNQRERSESPELDLDESTYQQPMTPRKVKRQNRYRTSGRSQKSTLPRGTNSRSSQGRGTYGRTSNRSRRPHYLNPVTQLIERANESSTSTDSFRPPAIGARPTSTFGGRQGHCNPMYVHSRAGSTFSLGSNEQPVERPPSVHSSYSNYHGQRTALIAPNLNPNGRPVPVNAFLRQPQLNSSFGDSQMGGYSTLKGSVCSDNSDMPPPYMFGVNSETVI